jgi:hypothetical protein
MCQGQEIVVVLDKVCFKAAVLFAAYNNKCATTGSMVTSMGPRTPNRHGPSVAVKCASVAWAGSGRKKLSTYIMHACMIDAFSAHWLSSSIL